MPKGQESEDGSGKRKRRRLREIPGDFIARTPWMRRRYAKYLARSLRKSRKKGRKLPENLVEIERRIRHLSPTRQVETIEQLLEFGSATRSQPQSRVMRRALERQDRRSGSGKGVRPGLPGGARQVRRQGPR
jgi:hypothetical protein